MRGQSSISRCTGGSSEHPAAVPWKCADVLTGLRKQISSVAPGASGFPSTPQAIKCGGAERGPKFESQPFHLLAGDFRHMLLKLLLWPQVPHVKEDAKMELIPAPTS